MEYNEKLEQVKEKYEERIMNILRSMKGALENEGHTVSDPEPLIIDDYRWEMLVYTHPDSLDSDELNEDDVDIYFELVDGRDYDGEEGINFSVSIVTVRGELLGGLTPYNYTENCWVDLFDDDAVEERFRLIEQADPSEVALLLE